MSTFVIDILQIELDSNLPNWLTQYRMEREAAAWRRHLDERQQQRKQKRRNERTL